MSTRTRSIGKWVLLAMLLLVALEGIHISILAHPFVLFSHKERFGEFTVYSRNPIPEGFAQTTDDVRSRIAAMEYAHQGNDIRIYLCDTQRFYSFFTFLVRKSSKSLGFGLSVFDNMYLNETRIRLFADRNHAGIRHSRFEGNYGEIIAHEIAHFNVVDELGYRAAIRLPFWMSEGYAEHQANVASVAADAGYDFRDRIAVLQRGGIWSANPIARDLFEWHVLVEYLIDVEGYGLRDLIDEETRLDATRMRMLAWYDRQRRVR